MTISLFFIFMGLIEYALAISWTYSAQERKLKKSTNDFSDEIKLFDNRDTLFYRFGRGIGKLLTISFGNVDFTKDPLSRNKVDYASRIIFPLTYLLFVIIYILIIIFPWASNYSW